MGDVPFVAWLIMGASALSLSAIAMGLTKSLILRGPRRLLESGLEHLNGGDVEAAARDFSLAHRKAYARGDLGATAAAWRGLAEVRLHRGDVDGSVAAVRAACDAEEQSRRGAR
jgi:hypothetical protein